MEPYSPYRPWHDKASAGRLFKPITGKYLHYYFYFIDERFGLGCVWAGTDLGAVRLQV